MYVRDTDKTDIGFPLVQLTKLAFLIKMFTLLFKNRYEDGFES